MQTITYIKAKKNPKDLLWLWGFVLRIKSSNYVGYNCFINSFDKILSIGFAQISCFGVTFLIRR